MIFHVILTKPFQLVLVSCLERSLTVVRDPNQTGFYVGSVSLFVLLLF